jgi:hypothetical protein
VSDLPDVDEAIGDTVPEYLAASGLPQADDQLYAELPSLPGEVEGLDGVLPPLAQALEDDGMPEMVGLDDISGELPDDYVIEGPTGDIYAELEKELPMLKEDREVLVRKEREQQAREEKLAKVKVKKTSAKDGKDKPAKKKKKTTIGEMVAKGDSLHVRGGSAAAPVISAILEALFDEEQE